MQRKFSLCGSNSRNLFSFLQSSNNAQKLLFTLFPMIFNVSVGENNATLYTGESFKMEEEHGDQQNLASSYGCKCFIREILQGFFL